MPEIFRDASRGVAAANASGKDRELVDLLDRHGREEGTILAKYQQLAEESQRGAVRYLVNLIVEDERRHHQVMEDIANAVAWRGFDAPAGLRQAPDLDAERAPDSLHEETRRLLEFEERDARELSELRRSLDDFTDTTLWALLIDMMILDTEKHTLVLKFLLEH